MMCLRLVHYYCLSIFVFFFFKQKTAYEMRISDWSSDVCSSDLALLHGFRVPDARAPFRYLELGCGQGFGLCLLAALYPHGAFVGVDFNPEHIAHARELAHGAGLSNEIGRAHV